jgi:hypothetical protein
MCQRSKKQSGSGSAAGVVMNGYRETLKLSLNAALVRPASLLIGTRNVRAKDTPQK